MTRQECIEEGLGKKLKGPAFTAFLDACLRENDLPPTPPGDLTEKALAHDITPEDAQVQAHAVMEHLLKDPYSAHWTCGTISVGAMGSGKIFGTDLYGDLLSCDINAKNSYGAYQGEVRYVFLFIGRKLRRVAELGREGFFNTQRIVYDD